MPRHSRLTDQDARAILARFERCETSLTAEAKRFGFSTPDSIRNVLARLVGEKKTTELVKAAAAVQGPKRHSAMRAARRAARQRAPVTAFVTGNEWTVEQGPVVEAELGDTRVLSVQRMNDQVLVCVTRPLSRITTAARAVVATMFLPVAGITRVLRALREAAGVRDDDPSNGHGRDPSGPVTPCAPASNRAKNRRKPAVKRRSGPALTGRRGRGRNRG